MIEITATALQAITIERTQNIQENERGSQLSDFTVIIIMSLISTMNIYLYNLQVDQSQDLLI
jgi:hypothetical protein